MLKRLVYILLFCTPILNTQAQVTSVSPYSRFGLGDIFNGSFAHHNSMGGLSVPMADSFLVNINNPATYSFTAKQSPTFDVGVRGRLVNFSTNTAISQNYSLSLSNIAMSVAFKKRWGLGFGIVPYSSTGYEINYDVEDPTAGTVNYAYEGGGGINRVFGGLAVRLINQQHRILSIGANASYLFGQTIKTRKVSYPDATNILNTKVLNTTNVNDVIFDAGLIYRDTITKYIAYRVGVTCGFPNEISASRTTFAHTYVGTENNEIVVDTVEYADDVKGTFKIPVKWGYGISFDFFGRGGERIVKGTGPDSTLRKVTRRNYKLTIGVQYEMQDWGLYEETFGGVTTGDLLKNSSSIKAGIQYIPRMYGNNSARIKPVQLINYRLGFYHNKSYLSLNGTEIKEYGITAGVGIPLIYSVSYSMLNIGFEIGKRGTIENNLVLEDYYGLNLGFSLSPHRQADRWFVKRKFD